MAERPTSEGLKDAQESVRALLVRWDHDGCFETFEESAERVVALVAKCLGVADGQDSLDVR